MLNRLQAAITAVHKYSSVLDNDVKDNDDDNYNTDDDDDDMATMTTTMMMMDE